MGKESLYKWGYAVQACCSGSAALENGMQSPSLHDSMNTQGFNTSQPAYSSFPGILLVLQVDKILPQGLVQVTLPQLNFS